MTHQGRPPVPVAEYAALEETAEILSDDDSLRAIQRGLADLAGDDVVSLDELRAEMATRR